MLDRRVFITGAAAGLVLAGCDRKADPNERVRLFLNWLYTASFAGDVLAARTFAPSKGLKLELQVGGEGRDPIKLVRDGDLGVASADEIIRAIGVGAPIVIIGVLNDVHPAAFAALKTSGIRTPRDFEGRRVGILPFGATGLIYEALIRKAGVDRSKVKEIVVTPDLRPFISGRVNDVQPIFMYDETVSLDKQGIAYEVIDPRAYGVSFKGQCYFTTRNTIVQSPDLVARTLEALLLGWGRAADAPQEAIAALRERSPTLDVTEETTRLRRALPFFVPKDRSRLFKTNPSEWRDMTDALLRSGVVTKPVDLASVLSLSTLDRAHAAIKS